MFVIAKVVGPMVDGAEKSTSTGLVGVADDFQNLKRLENNKFAIGKPASWSTAGAPPPPFRSVRVGIELAA